MPIHLPMLGLTQPQKNDMVAAGIGASTASVPLAVLWSVLCDTQLQLLEQNREQSRALVSPRSRSARDAQSR
jgi:hypothetical protein